MSGGGNKTKKPLHLGIGHFWIGTRDGVNASMMRNIEGLLEIQPETRITLFGKLADHMEGTVKPVPGKIEYVNVEEFDPDFEIPGLPRRTISEQKIQDYISHGSNIMEMLVEKLRPMDVVIVENLGIGINPAVRYAFYAYLQYCQHHYPQKRILYRTHDFLQQRAKNFENLKKFQDKELPLIPNWHEIIYPNYPNVGYITINTNDVSRLIEHGIDRERIAYVPNCIDDSLIMEDGEHQQLRRRLVEQMGLASDVRFILYPVRCIRRKNVEEAVFLIRLLNYISRQKIKVQGMNLEGTFHLLVTIRPRAGEDLEYAEAIEAFCKKHGLPVTIGLQDFISYERAVNPSTTEIVKFGLGDAYNMAEVVITTSYLEGFGFAFIEPWYIGKAVIGRNISNITQDFQRAGVNLDHLYNVFRIDGQDFYSIGYQDKEHIGLERRLQEILKLENSSHMKDVIEANEYNLGALISFLIPDRGEATIRKNHHVIASTYSKRGVAERLWRVLTHVRFGSFL